MLVADRVLLYRPTELASTCQAWVHLNWFAHVQGGGSWGCACVLGDFFTRHGVTGFACMVWRVMVQNSLHSNQSQELPWPCCRAAAAQAAALCRHHRPRMYCFARWGCGAYHMVVQPKPEPCGTGKYKVLNVARMYWLLGTPFRVY